MMISIGNDTDYPLLSHPPFTQLDFKVSGYERLTTAARDTKQAATLCYGNQVDLKSRKNCTSLFQSWNEDNFHFNAPIWSVFTWTGYRSFYFWTNHLLHQNDFFVSLWVFLPRFASRILCCDSKDTIKYSPLAKQTYDRIYLEKSRSFYHFDS